MRFEMSALFFLLFCLLLIHSSSAKIVRGSVDSTQNWVFLTRFCFLGSADSGNGHVGRLEWNITYLKDRDGNSTHPTPHVLLLYPDDEWDEAYPGDHLSCDEKAALLDGSGNTRSVSPDKVFSGCESSTVGNGVEKYTCSAGTTFGTPIEKWWYMVIENCASTRGIVLDYEMVMTNSQDGSIFFEHYSADEFFILQTDIGFLVAYVLMVGLSLYVTLCLIKLQLFHTTYKMYMASLGLEVIALIIQVIYWSNYGVTGIPKDDWKYVGRFLEFVSTIVFVVLLILMGKGYTITRGRIRKIGVIKIIAFSTIYCLITISMFIWEATSFDPGKVLYIYDSAPGYCLIGVRILAWLWFCYATFFTVKNYSEKRMFYLPFFIIYCIWFWAGPIVVFVAFKGIPKWTREKVVNGVDLIVIFIGHLVFLIFTWPNQANENFPYHVKTSQITDASLGDPDRGDAYNPDIPVEQVSYRRNSESIFTTQTNGTSHPVNIDRFPHESGEHIQNRAAAMSQLYS